MHDEIAEACLLSLFQEVEDHLSKQQYLHFAQCGKALQMVLHEYGCCHCGKRAAKHYIAVGKPLLLKPTFAFLEVVTYLIKCDSSCLEANMSILHLAFTLFVYNIVSVVLWTVNNLSPPASLLSSM